MKDFSVRKLSDYKTDDLLELEIVLSIAYEAAKKAGNRSVMMNADAWAYVLREALREKGTTYINFDEVDENPIGI